MRPQFPKDSISLRQPANLESSAEQRATGSTARWRAAGPRHAAPSRTSHCRPLRASHSRHPRPCLIICCKAPNWRQCGSLMKVTQCGALVNEPCDAEVLHIEHEAFVQQSIRQATVCEGFVFVSSPALCWAHVPPVGCGVVCVGVQEGTHRY